MVRFRHTSLLAASFLEATSFLKIWLSGEMSIMTTRWVDVSFAPSFWVKSIFKSKNRLFGENCSEVAFRLKNQIQKNRAAVVDKHCGWFDWELAVGAIFAIAIAIQLFETSESKLIWSSLGIVGKLNTLIGLGAFSDFCFYLWITLSWN